MQILEVVSGDLSNKFILEQLQWLKGNRNEAHLLWQVVWKTGSFSNSLKANSKLKRCYFDFSHEKGRQKGHWMIISLYHSQKTLFFLILVQLFSQPVALMAWRITINSVLTFHLNFLGSNSGLVPHATDIQHRWTHGCHIISHTYLQNRGWLMLLMALQLSAKAVPWPALNGNLLRTAVHHMVCFQAQLTQSNQFSGKEPSCPS